MFGEPAPDVGQVRPGPHFGSLALKADAIHSLADVVSSFTIFLGIVIADRKTRTFPEGLYKVENLVALASSFFIFFAAYEIDEKRLKDIRWENYAIFPPYWPGSHSLWRSPIFFLGTS